MSAAVPLTDVPELHDPALYLNRELSHLEFQRRVLEEARDARNPLLERVKFLSILGSNIDEFFMVRVAGLMQQIENKVEEPGMDGRLPGNPGRHSRGNGPLMNEAYAFYREELAPELAAAEYPASGSGRVGRHAARQPGQPLFGQDFPGADAARFRSRPAVSAHFESQFQHGGGGARSSAARSISRA